MTLEVSETVFTLGSIKTAKHCSDATSGLGLLEIERDLMSPFRPTYALS